MNKTLQAFLTDNNFKQFSVRDFTQSLLDDMASKLEAKKKDPTLFPQQMILASKQIPGPVSSGDVIIIDAGGTNFRTCLMTKNPDGSIEIKDLHKTRMPGIEKELSKDEFFNCLTVNLSYLKNKASRIGFCFSYAMEMSDDGDGKVLAFSKEIKAPEVVGCYIGKELKSYLEKDGWTTIEKISLLNDTTASLLAGLSQAKKDYSSYAGFILGTGLNNAYIEKNTGIIVCESGLFSDFEKSSFDKYVDDNSTNPGTAALEKACSGAYLGPIAHVAIEKAANKKLFSENFLANFINLVTKPGNTIKTPDIDHFLYKKEGILENLLKNCPKSDRKLLKELLLQIIDRAAVIVASILSATVLKSEEGLSKKNPVCIVCNGTTFWKTYGLKKNALKYLKKNLSGDFKRYYEIKQIDDDIYKGAFVAGKQ